MQHAVVEDEPALAGLDGRRSGAHLHALPGTHLEGCRRHHVAVVAPELHVGRLAVEDVAEGSVAGVAGSAEHGVAAIDLPWEEHAVAVVGQEGVLHLVERLEVLGPGHADGRSVVAVAPGHPPTVVDAADARVIAIDPLADFLVITLKLQRFLVDVPVQTIVAEAHVERHAAVGVVAAKYAGIAFAEGYDSTVEDAV